MAIATYQDLCIDAVDPLLMGRFWADLLGRDLRERDDGLVELTGVTPRHTIWVNPVPEPVTVKQRVHLDVHVPSTSAALALGATPVDLTSFAWDVLRDPEGGELCVFPREQVPDERLYEIVVDAHDLPAQAAWWAQVLGGRVGADGDSIEDIPGAPFEMIVLEPVPEPRTVKNRIHWDVAVPGPKGLDALVAAGARVVRPREADLRWTVLADPEGNEFCAFTD
jgi:hypothetical protein